MQNIFRKMPKSREMQKNAKNYKIYKKCEIKSKITQKKMQYIAILFDIIDTY